MGVLLLPTAARELKENPKRHGPLDGHSVKVYEILEEMSLERGILAECLAIAQTSQDSWRAWFKANQEKVEQNQDRIDNLKAGEDRAALKAAQAEKKEFMHAAPSLLRDPRSLKRTLSDDQYGKFLVKLERLKKALHKPNSPSRAKCGR